MTRKRILLTGDDGYNSIGIRLLIRALRDKYDLQVAATLHQQTGVGGKISLSTGGKWGQAEVDGIPAVWVEGSPADVMECAPSFFSEPFDLLISGMNLGANVTSAIVSSGTFCAAIRGMGVNLAPKGIAISWDAPAEFWHKKYDGTEDASEYFAYPGDALSAVIERSIEENLWGVKLLNINLPKKPTKTVRFTKVLKDITRYYAHPIIVDHETHRFAYPTEPMEVREDDLRYDAFALEQGNITITPCAIEMTHFTTFSNMQDEVIEL